MKSSSQQPATLDNYIDVITPENVSFQYEIAGPFRRLLAFLIDVLIIGLTLLVLFILLVLFVLVTGGSFGTIGISVGFYFVAVFVLVFFYFGLFETMWNGQTPGKRLLKLRVLTITGQPINALQAVLRNLLRFVDAMPAAPGIQFLFFSSHLLGLFTVAMNDRYQRLGDLACGTMVIVEARSWLYGLKQLRHPAIIQMAADIPANFEVSSSLGQALASYIDRRDLFTLQRRADLARHIGRPLAARFLMPVNTNHDLLLCALYYRTFDAQGEEDSPQQIVIQTR